MMIRFPGVRLQSESEGCSGKGIPTHFEFLIAKFKIWCSRKGLPIPNPCYPDVLNPINPSPFLIQFHIFPIIDFKFFLELISFTKSTHLSQNEWVYADNFSSVHLLVPPSPLNLIFSSSTFPADQLSSNCTGPRLQLSVAVLMKSWALFNATLPPSLPTFLPPTRGQPPKCEFQKLVSSFSKILLQATWASISLFVSKLTWFSSGFFLKIKFWSSF